MVGAVGVAGCSITVTTIVISIDGSNVEVALTISVEALSEAPTDSTPEELMLEAVPPTTSHITVWGGLFVPTTVALKLPL